MTKTFKEKQYSLHLDTLNQILEILETRTAEVQFKHIYSHTSENMKKQVNSQHK